MTRRNRKAGGKPAGHRPTRADIERIYGTHAALAALSNPVRKIKAVYATRNALERLNPALEKPLAISVRDVGPDELSKRLGADAVHQGILVEAEPLEPVSLEEAIAASANGMPLIVLDQVTDPHNVGAILRSAAAFNAAAVITTRRNSPPLDGTLAKAASGAVEHVPIILIANLARTLGELAANGVTAIGLDGGSRVALESAELSHPLALVLGAEHRGMRRLTAENCEMLCRLETTGALASLNVSNAAAVALHWISRTVK